MEKKLKVIQTARDTGTRLTAKPPVRCSKKIKENIPLIEINNEEKYQKIIGFGGAFIEAAAYTLSQISAKKRKEILKKYFDPWEGIGYSMGRVHINSCDFSLENYSYVGSEDIELKTFDISREKKWVLPVLKEAEKIAGQSLKLLASPWSPPAWMKSNQKMSHGGKLLPE